MNKQLLRLNTFVLSAATVLALGACGRSDDGRTAGQKVDAAIAKTEQAGSELSAEAKAAAERARQALGNGANKAGDGLDNAVDKLSNKVSDAGITASVNAELAKDAALSALRIDVDTSDGKVRLSGTAPTVDARQRATLLAQSVKGVVSVENRLEVRG